MRSYHESAARFYGGDTVPENPDVVAFVMPGADGLSEKVIVSDPKKVPAYGAISALARLLEINHDGKCRQSSVTKENSVLVREYWTHFLRAVNKDGESYGWTQRLMQPHPDWNSVYLLADAMEAGAVLAEAHRDCAVNEAVPGGLFSMASSAVMDICHEYVEAYKTWLKSKAESAKTEEAK